MRAFLVKILLIMLPLFSFSCKPRNNSNTRLLNDTGKQKKQIFFHWQDEGGNRRLLETGGYPLPDGQSHAAGLSVGASATLNQATMDQIWEWYSRERTDAAGSGLYVCANPFDSKSYGDDLLIVEFDTKDGLDKQSVPKRPGIKIISDAAHKDGTVGYLPLISRYSFDTWYSISRIPTDQDGVKISFRPPSANDVNLMAKEFLDGKEHSQQLEFLDQLRKVISQESSINKEFKPAARMVFHRLLFDHGYEAIKLIDLKALDAPQRETYEKILVQFKETIPQDPKTRELSLRYFDVTYSEEKLRDAGFLRLTSEIFEDLKPGQQQEVIVEVAKFTPDELKKFPTEVLRILAKGKKNFEAQVSPVYPPLKEAILKGEVVVKEEVGNLIPFLTGLDVVDSQAVAAELLASRVLNFDSNIETGGYAGQERAMANFITEAGQLGWNLPKLLDIYANRIFSSPKKSVTKIDQVVIALTEYIVEKNPPNAPDLVTYIAKLTSDTAKNITGKYSAILQDYGFLELLKRNQTPDYAKKVFYLIFENVPELRTIVLRDVGSILEHPTMYGITDANMLLSLQGMRQELTDKLKAASSPNDKATEAYKNLPEPFKKIVDEATFRKHFLRSTDNIQGSFWHSEVSRMFLLVDPIFVSEDLRTMNAKWPFERFNEQYSTPQGNHQQKVWQNFLEAWNKGVLTYSMDTTPEPIKKNPNWRTFIFEHAYHDINNKLVAGFTDGSGLSKLFDTNWDRSKYKTEFSKDFWAMALTETSEAELRKYFDISVEETKVTLMFKSQNDLFQSLNTDFLGDFSSNEPQKILRIMLWFASQEKDPIKRAAKILYLLPRLHPYENGNGRMARLLAAIELKRAGLPMPVGLPTNDFLMSEARIELELRKSLVLGRYWEEMLSDAASKKVPIGDFFQKIFKGSALEGLTLLSFDNSKDLKSFIEYLEKQKSPPKWAEEFLLEAEKSIAVLRS